MDTKNNYLPGIKPVLELLREQPQRIIKIFCRDGRHDNAPLLSLCQKNAIKIEYTNNSFLDSICGFDSRKRAPVAHQGVVALITSMQFTDFDKLLIDCLQAPLPLIISLDQVQDSGNIGSICRTAWALGCAGIVAPKHNSGALGPAAAKSSAGALEKIPFSIVNNLSRALDLAEEKGFTIYGAACADNNICAHAINMNAFDLQWQFPSIIVLGNENRGIRPGVAKRCSIMVNIPFARKFDSLNVAQSCAILTGLCARQVNGQNNLSD